MLQEQIRRSQRVESFTVVAQQADGQWQNIGGATTIGYKHLLAVPETTVSHIRSQFDTYRVATAIAEFGLN